jgi:hypothetical protein
MNNKLRSNSCSLVLRVLLLLAAFAAGNAEAMGWTTYISGKGADTNTSASCSMPSPCRSLQAALSQTNAGGVVVALDSAEYFPATISQSVSVTAPEGVHAQISTSNGNAITVSVSGLSVTLRGLYFWGTPAFNIPNQGVYLPGGNSLVVERCHFNGFALTPGSSSDGTAIDIVGNAASRVQAKIIDTVIEDGSIGIQIVGSVTASISNVKLFNLGVAGIGVTDGGYGEADVSASNVEWNGPSLTGGTAFQVVNQATPYPAEFFLDRAVITGGANGVLAKSGGGLAYVTVTNSVFSKANMGIAAQAPTTGTTMVSVSASTFDANGAGVGTSGANANVYTAGNNNFVGNGSNWFGNFIHFSTF